MGGSVCGALSQKTTSRRQCRCSFSMLVAIPAPRSRFTCELGLTAYLYVGVIG